MDVEKTQAEKPQRRIFMKKSKILAVGLIALLMAGALAAASCGDSCRGDGNCYYLLSGDHEGENKWCSDTKCAVYGTNNVTATQQSISCDC